MIAEHRRQGVMYGSERHIYCLTFMLMMLWIQLKIIKMEVHALPLSALCNFKSANCRTFYLFIFVKFHCFCQSEHRKTS